MICKRCLFDSNTPSVTFDSDGVCNYCRLHDQWEKEYADPDNTKLLKIYERIRKRGKRKRYDCVVGVSGGCDSSFTLHLAVKAGLRPLAVHFNNNWNTPIAEANIRKMVSGLNCGYYEVAVNKAEYDSICRSFILAGVPDADIPNDIALQTAFYLAADKFDVFYTLSGHSFRTEGTTPLGWSYMDAKYIESVQTRFGAYPLRTFPNLWLGKWLTWLWMGIKQIRPLWYVKYDKDEARKILHDSYGWEWYGGAHLENKYTEFIGSYYQPRRFNIDLRRVLWSAQVRSGTLDREQALYDLEVLPTIRTGLLYEVEQRLRLPFRELETIMRTGEKHTHEDYETYLPTFHRYAWLFRVMSDLNLVPKTFYTKYCKGVAPK